MTINFISFVLFILNDDLKKKFALLNNFLSLILAIQKKQQCHQRMKITNQKTLHMMNR
mgnify:CR=1 FL=1